MVGIEKLKPLVIIGAGGHAVSVMNVGLSAGYKVSCFVDPHKKRTSLCGYSIIGELDELKNLESYSYVVAIGDNFLREKIYLEILSISPNLDFPALVHHSATISSFSNVGRGSVIMPNSTVGPKTQIGNFCIVNTQSSIDHDSAMGDFSSLAPGSVLGGGCQVGLRSAVSIGAVVKHGVTIGEDSVLGSNSYLNKNLGDRKVAYGSPAKEIRDRKANDSYLK